MKILSSALRFLSSMKLAVFLIAAIVVMSILATLYPDVNFYQSGSFLGVLGVFFLNLSLCTIKVLPNLKKTLQRQAKDLSDQSAGYERYVMPEGTSTKAWIETFLGERKYGVTQVEESGCYKILGKKGKVSLLAPHLLHVGILIVLGGAWLNNFGVSGGVFGYIGGSNPLPGEVREVIGESELEVVDFQTVYDEKGDVDNWVTTFNLYIEGEKVVENGETKVNFPYKHQDLVIYQNSYGYQHLIEITGLEAGAYSINDDWHFPLGELEFMLKNLNDGRVLFKAYQDEEVVLGQIVEMGDKVEVSPGTVIEYLGPNPYTVLEVKVSPGTKIVFLGFLLATIASMLFWSGRYREVRVLILKDSPDLWVSCFSKSKVIMEEVITGLEEQLKGGND